MLWTITAFLRDEQSSTARPPDRHPTSAGKKGQAVRRWVARQDGSLDPDVPACQEHSASYTPDCHRGSIPRQESSSSIISQIKSDNDSPRHHREPC